MKRVLTTMVLAVTAALSMMPTAGASEDSMQTCHEVWVHFRPTVCYEFKDGQIHTWVCPDRYATGCTKVTPVETI